MTDWFIHSLISMQYVSRSLGLWKGMLPKWSVHLSFPSWFVRFHHLRNTSKRIRILRKKSCGSIPISFTHRYVTGHINITFNSEMSKYICTNFMFFLVFNDFKECVQIIKGRNKNKIKYRFKSWTFNKTIRNCFKCIFKNALGRIWGYVNGNGYCRIEHNSEF